MLERLGYDSLYELDYESFSIAGEKVFDMENMLGTPSAKVMARILRDSIKCGKIHKDSETKDEITNENDNNDQKNNLVCENVDG